MSSPPVISAETSREELAAIVAETLRLNDIDAVLVGGAVVAMYSEDRYVTDDLDFVTYRPLKQVRPVMEQLGFRMIGNRAEHPETNWYVQFCAPPLAVGHRVVAPVERATVAGTLAVLSPTDCVLDRLMKYFHWGDQQGLEQALLVASAQDIDLRTIKSVSIAEGAEELFAVFERRLRGKR